jgi:hypothetical protein
LAFAVLPLPSKSALGAGFAGDAKRNLSRWRGWDAASRNGRGHSETIVPFLIGKHSAPEMVAELSKAFDHACSELMALRRNLPLGHAC